MKRRLINTCLIWLSLFLTTSLFAQENGDSQLSKEEVARYRDQVGQLVNYLEGTLNFIGDPESVITEKEIIINNSYLKIFVDDKVQVEDDLLENREVPLHKDVQAYLKDVEFFFDKVQFKFIISDITFNTGEDNLVFFKVTINRDLEGITVDGDTVNNRKIRYIEVNVNQSSGDLRIASMYTTKLNEKEELKNWWNNMDSQWKKILAGDTLINDSIMLRDILTIQDDYLLISKEDPFITPDTSLNIDFDIPDERQQVLQAGLVDTLAKDSVKIYNYLNSIQEKTSVNISNRMDIRTLEPLSEMSKLIEINCSNTLITNLFPVRNLNHLQKINFANTPVDDISPLAYSTSIKEIDCSFTLLGNLNILSGLYNLEVLKCSGLRINDPGFASSLMNLKELYLSETNIFSLEPIDGLSKLEKLDVSGTGIRNLESISSFKNLVYLNCENTSVTLLDSLKNLTRLEILNINYTGVESLQPIIDLKNIKRIYWDTGKLYQVNKKKKKNEAITFMMKHEGALVIYESMELIEGWANLEQPWKDVIRNLVDIGDNPTNEELHALLKFEKLDLSGTEITMIRPLSQLYNLKKLNLSGISIDDYSPLEDARELQYLNLAGTNIKSLEVLSSMTKLKELNISGTVVDDLEPVTGLPNLEVVIADSSGINDKSALVFKQERPECNIIYKTSEVTFWWENLSEEWKTYFMLIHLSEDYPDTEQLHQLLFLEKLEINRTSGISNLEPLKEIIALKSLKIEGLDINNLNNISGFRNLRELYITKMAIQDLAPLSSLRKLQLLDIENTSVKDLDPLTSLGKLESLNVSGTQVRSLKPLAGLVNLKNLQLNNTAVRNLKHLLDLPRLESLSCFNSRVSARNIEKFKAAMPDCKVVYY